MTYTLIQQTLKNLRDTWGTTVTIDGNNYSVTTATAPPNRAGSGFLPRDLEPFELAADPRSFSFSIQDFASNPIPAFGTIINYHGSDYTTVRVSNEDAQNATISLRVFGYKVLDADTTSVFLQSPMQLWLPNTLIQQLDPNKPKNVLDVGFTRTDDINVLLMPLTHEEKMMIFGSVDIRSNLCYSPVEIPLGAILYDPTVPIAWVAITPSEFYQSTSLHIATVRHMQTIPTQITSQ